mgnify:CR=1 FL=1
MFADATYSFDALGALEPLTSESVGDGTGVPKVEDSGDASVDDSVAAKGNALEPLTSESVGDRAVATKVESAAAFKVARAPKVESAAAFKGEKLGATKVDQFVEAKVAKYVPGAKVAKYVPGATKVAKYVPFGDAKVVTKE